MDKPIISFFLPCIRVHLIKELYESLLKSFSLPFEIVLAGPFEPPDEVKLLPNISWIKTFASPTKSAQLAALACKGDLIAHITDDVLFFPESMDKAYELYLNSGPYDIISLRYIESAHHESKESFPLHYWTMANFTPVPTIPRHYNINAHFLMRKDLFVEFGGFDCCFEYLTHACADLLIRIQKDGATVRHSPTDVTTADWSGGTKGLEHKPIQIAQENFDLPTFWNIWMNNPQARSKIDLANFQSYPDVWERRFKGKTPTSYQELELS